VEVLVVMSIRLLRLRVHLQQQATRKYIRGAGGLGLTAVFALCAIALKKTDSEETL
jgi:hypothetical protein